jgi:putative ABC transport system permease protein
MNFKEAVLISLRSLRANRLRSLLTLLGIVIGVMTVIAVISFISGLNDYVAGKVFNLGTDVFVLSRAPAITVSIEDFVDSQKRKNLTLDDLDAIRRACTDCKSVGGALAATGRVKRGREYLDDTQIQGNTYEVLGILGTTLEMGRPMTEYEVDHGRRVCIVGADVVDNLVPFSDPIGKTIVVNDEEFEIIGVAEKQGAVLGQSRDNWVAIPITLHQKMFGARRSLRIYGKAIDETRLRAAEDQARLVMRTRHHVPYNERDDFSLSANENFLAIWANISRSFFAVTIGIASISLVVGGIVVMNIMLVSVTERTREIGIRKASGARRYDILLQFLVESATLSLIGGIIGILLGSALSLGVSWLTPLPATIKWWSIVLALVVSTGVGLFFGIYPARKAANLDPIVALRYE